MKNPSTYTNAGIFIDFFKIFSVKSLIDGPLPKIKPFLFF